MKMRQDHAAKPRHWRARPRICAICQDQRDPLSVMVNAVLRRWHLAAARNYFLKSPLCSRADAFAISINEI
jgi:hypothetical protein